MKFRAVIISVDFGDFLELTLPWNREHFSEDLVITTPNDVHTQLVASANGARLFVTNAFYEGGAPFAKFRALELGLEEFGRHDWMALIDADTFWPKAIPQTAYMIGRLYSFRRRRLLLDATASIPPESEWGSLPIDPQSICLGAAECMGFTQIFHADDGHLGNPPWHDTSLPTAALGDSKFQAKWALHDKTWIDCDCLHIGQYAVNWCGRVTPYRDGSSPKDAVQKQEEQQALMRKLWP